MSVFDLAQHSVKMRRGNSRTKGNNIYIVLRSGTYLTDGQTRVECVGTYGTLTANLSQNPLNAAEQQTQQAVACHKIKCAHLSVID